MSIVVVWL